MPGNSGWTPPDLSGPITTEEAVRVIGRQLQTVTQMIGHVAATQERHEHWHDERQDEELANARRAPRENLLAWCQLLGTVATLVSVIVLLVQLGH